MAAQHFKTALPVILPIVTIATVVTVFQQFSNSFREESWLTIVMSQLEHIIEFSGRLSLESLLLESVFATIS
jgi:hypothetical protein